ncbi:MAG: hydantoinase B/oxoprolinase family protein [Chloroflexi bacterium]|nr:hydantoinase B/oxoprolinase family protein [Chloroflexota bacterium]
MAQADSSRSLDPIKYEIYSHRLYNILEEGRITIRRVTGSAMVAEGGETLCSFYMSDGTPVLTASGILLHCTGARDFVLKAIEWYEDDPGIYDGDQLLFNDPYIGGQHLCDHIIIKPIFYDGRRIAWCGSFMHTPETGAISPGGMPGHATNIWQEGVAFKGLKIVEAGKFRPDVFNTVCGHSRDPHLVGLDTKAKIAANNVCAKRLMSLIEKYGLEFVEAANARIIEDSEKMVRARLLSLPDGVWRSRLYGDTDGLGEKPYRVVCTMTKKGDKIIFDYTGSSPQNAGSLNSTLPATWGSLFVVLASQLFWNVSWNGGMLRPVMLIAPEGTVVNCRYPAAVSRGVVSAGNMVTATAHACIARMLLAADHIDEVNSVWRGASGPSVSFGGINQHGERAAGQILEGFASGLGATPYRDGVDTGGEMMNPTSNIADVEVLESGLPFLYLSRCQASDSGGPGRFRGGTGIEMVYAVYGARSLEVGLQGSGRRSPVNRGICGGYPASIKEVRVARNSNITELWKQGQSVVSFDEIDRLEAQHVLMPACSPSGPMYEYDIISPRRDGGGGYGDPLERDLDRVADDVATGLVSRLAAERFYGVALDGCTGKPNIQETESLRKQLRNGRLKPE